MKDPYGVLGLERNTSPERLKAKYEELRAIYGEQRFKSGEEGNEGARKLQELEEAWSLISADIERDAVAATFDGDYGKVDALIREGKYNEAQDMLDRIQDRGGEWHYMQAIVFYKREWLTESKAQLEMALRENPDNAKYRASLDKLNMAINGTQNGTQSAQTSSAYGNAGTESNVPPPYDVPQQNPADMSNCLSSCCCAYCLTDCLCNAMRCC